MGCCCSSHDEIPMIKDQLVPDLNPVVTQTVEKISSDSGETPLFPPASDDDDNEVISDVEILSEQSDGSDHVTGEN